MAVKFVDFESSACRLLSSMTAWFALDAFGVGLNPNPLLYDASESSTHNCLVIDVPVVPVVPVVVALPAALMRMVARVVRTTF